MCSIQKAINGWRSMPLNWGHRAVFSPPTLNHIAQLYQGCQTVLKSACGVSREGDGSERATVEVFYFVDAGSPSKPPTSRC